MFVSYDVYENDVYCSIKVIDTGFTETRRYRNPLTNSGLSHHIGKYVIEIYEARGLPVAGNLFKAMQLRAKELDFYIPSSLNYVIRANKQLNELYAKYADEVEKLMVLV